MPPAGYKRSRALWDEARRKDATLQTKLRAVLYELQPIRFSEANRRYFTKAVLSLIHVVIYVVKNIPTAGRALMSFARTRTKHHWMVLAAVVAYYLFIRWIHELLDAGPLVVIITSLIAIWTVGLGDTTHPDGVSAYSVFNRGFERLLGSVDVDSLLAQHVGGGMGGVGVMDGGGFLRAQPDDEPQQQQPARGGVARARGNNLEDDEEDDDDASENDNVADDNNNNNNNNRARKSGKKARRRDLEQRREIRRQREAAAEIGMRDDGTGAVAPEEMIAIQRLIEEQIAAEQANGN